MALQLEMKIAAGSDLEHVSIHPALDAVSALNVMEEKMDSLLARGDEAVYIEALSYKKFGPDTKVIRMLRAVKSRLSGSRTAEFIDQYLAESAALKTARALVLRFSNDENKIKAVALSVMRDNKTVNTLGKAYDGHWFNLDELYELLPDAELVKGFGGLKYPDRLQLVMNEAPVIQKEEFPGHAVSGAPYQQRYIISGSYESALLNRSEGFAKIIRWTD